MIQCSWWRLASVMQCSGWSADVRSLSLYLLSYVIFFTIMNIEQLCDSSHVVLRNSLNPEKVYLFTSTQALPDHYIPHLPSSTIPPSFFCSVSPKSLVWSKHLKLIFVCPQHIFPVLLSNVYFFASLKLFLLLGIFRYIIFLQLLLPL